MDFEINGMKWIIKLKNGQELIKVYNEQNEEKATFLFGYTDFTTHEIWINESTCFDQMCMTLSHELTHCWLFNCGMYYADGMHPETVCEIVSNSYRFIHDVVERFKDEFSKRSDKDI